jgi:Uri superfamily endonuclease
VLAVEAHGEIEVGRLGRQKFDRLYLYVGSALGPGGLRRVERHRAVAQGRNQTRRWHIDYLLALGELKRVLVMETEERLECTLAQELAKRFQPAIPGFGSGDCRCKTHLFRASGPWERLVSEAMRSLTAGRVK